VEPGVREARDALARWAVLLSEVIPPTPVTIRIKVRLTPPRGRCPAPAEPPYWL
jgi:hypothetical protein